MKIVHVLQRSGNESGDCGQRRHRGAIADDIDRHSEQRRERDRPERRESLSDLFRPQELPQRVRLSVGFFEIKPARDPANFFSHS
jgi:hypothetical protein